MNNSDTIKSEVTYYGKKIYLLNPEIAQKIMLSTNDPAYVFESIKENTERVLH